MNENEQKTIIQELDSLIEELSKGDESPDEEVLELIDDIAEKINSGKRKKQDKVSKDLVEKLDTLISLTQSEKDSSSETSQSIIKAIEKIKLDIPYPEVNVPAPVVTVTVPEIKVPPTVVPPIEIPKVDVHMPDEMQIKKPLWFPKIEPLKPIVDAITEIKNKIVNFHLPTSPSDAVSVRLTDGEKFYKAIGGMVSSIGSTFRLKLLVVQHRQHWLMMMAICR